MQLNTKNMVTPILPARSYHIILLQFGSYTQLFVVQYRRNYRMVCKRSKLG